MTTRRGAPRPFRSLPPKPVARAKPALEVEQREGGDWLRVSLRVSPTRSSFSLSGRVSGLRSRPQDDDEHTVAVNTRRGAPPPFRTSPRSLDCAGKAGARNAPH